uniref:Uncharacterized protein n=1 Tax=Chlamydomonas sp. HS-5 TaxID=108458 RepID=Q9XFU9_9CHLO|nr:hypothetical protein [Chlamydomonas sp. HS-5]
MERSRADPAPTPPENRRSARPRTGQSPPRPGRNGRRRRQRMRCVDGPASADVAPDVRHLNTLRRGNEPPPAPMVEAKRQRRTPSDRSASAPRTGMYELECMLMSPTRKYKGKSGEVS